MHRNDNEVSFDHSGGSVFRPLSPAPSSAVGEQFPTSSLRRHQQRSAENDGIIGGDGQRSVFRGDWSRMSDFSTGAVMSSVVVNNSAIGTNNVRTGQGKEIDHSMMPGTSQSPRDGKNGDKGAERSVQVISSNGKTPAGDRKNLGRSYDINPTFDSDPEGIAAGFDVLEKRIHELEAGKFTVVGSQVNRLQQATDTYTELLRLKRDHLRMTAESENNKIGYERNVGSVLSPRTLMNGLTSSSKRQHKSVQATTTQSFVYDSPNVIEAVRSASDSAVRNHSDNRANFVSPTLEDDLPQRKGINQWKPLRPSSPGGSTVGSVGIGRLNDSHRSKVQGFADQIRKELTANQDALRKAPNNDHRPRNHYDDHPEADKRDNQFDYNYGRQQQQQLGEFWPTKTAPPVNNLGSNVGNNNNDISHGAKLSHPPPGSEPLGTHGHSRLDWANLPRSLDEYQRRRPAQANQSPQSHHQVPTDDNVPIFSENVHNNALKRRLADLRDRVREMTERGAADKRERATSPICGENDENIRPAPMINLISNQSKATLCDHNRLPRPPPFIAAKSTSASHSVHVNLQQLLASLKQQNVMLRQVAGRLPQNVSVAEMASSFRIELRKMLVNAENRLGKLLDKYDAHDAEYQEIASSGSQTAKELNRQLEEISWRVERADLEIERLRAQLIRLDSAVFSHHDRHYKDQQHYRHQSAQPRRMTGNRITQHTQASLQRCHTAPSISTPVLPQYRQSPQRHGSRLHGATGSASNTHSNTHTSAQGGQQIRELRVLQNAFAP